MNRVFREEKKFLISLPEALQISSRLSQVMLEDAHNGIHGYRIRSLYFDTIDDTDYYEKAAGVELRRKLRLRCYDPAADFAMLEMKQKQGASQLKRSLRVTREDAQTLTRGDYAPLLRYGRTDLRDHAKAPAPRGAAHAGYHRQHLFAGKHRLCQSCHAE